MSNPNKPIDPLIFATTVLVNQHQLPDASGAVQANLSQASEGSEEWVDDWMRKSGETPAVPNYRHELAKIGAAIEFSDIIPTGKVERLNDMGKDAQRRAQRPAIERYHKISGRTKVEHLTEEEHRALLGLNTDDRPTHRNHKGMGGKAVELYDWEKFEGDESDSSESSEEQVA